MDTLTTQSAAKLVNDAAQHEKFFFVHYFQIMISPFKMFFQFAKKSIALMAFKTAHCTVHCMAHKGQNSPKRFTNLHVTDSSSPQNEKLLSYRKQKSCLGSKLNFVFYTCLPHFTLVLKILADLKKVIMSI